MTTIENKIKEILSTVRTDTTVGKNLAIQYLLREFHKELGKAVKETAREGRWCQFCGDEMACFGCQVMPDRKMGKHLVLLLVKVLSNLKQEYLGKGKE